MVRNNDLEDKMYMLETAEEWPFLREAIVEGGVLTAGGGGDGDQQQQQEQQHLLCDVLMGEPFYYRVSSFACARVEGLGLEAGTPSID